MKVARSNLAWMCIAAASGIMLVAALLARDDGPLRTSWRTTQPSATAAEGSADVPLSDPDAAAPRSTIDADPAFGVDNGSVRVDDSFSPQSAELRASGRLYGLPTSVRNAELVVSDVDPTLNVAPRSVRHPVATIPEFDVRIRDEMLRALQVGRELRVWAEAAGTRSSEARVRFAEAILERGDSHAIYRIRCELEFESLAALTGSVVDDEDIGVERASVAVFRPAGGASTPSLYASTRTDRNGRFTFQLKACGRMLVVAHRVGSRATMEEIEVECARSSELMPLRLTRGACVRGIVRADSPLRSVDGIRLGVWPAREGDSTETIMLNGQSMRWTGRRFEPVSLSIVTDHEGAFELCGLANGNHRVIVNGPSFGCLLPGVPGITFDVMAPAADVVIPSSYPVLGVLVLHDGNPISRALVVIRQDGQTIQCPTVDSGFTEFGVPPARTYSIEVSAEGFETRHVDVAALAPHELRLERVSLRPLAQPCTLALEVDAQESELLQRIDIQLERIVDGALQPTLGFPINRRIENGAVELDGLAPGRYRVEVRATAGEDLRTFLAPHAFELDLVSGRRDSRVVEFALGGRLHVRVRNPDGAPLGARCWIEDRSGTRLPVMFIVVGSDGGVIHRSPQDVYAPADGNSLPSEVAPALAIGEYTLHCESNGHRASAVRFEIRAEEVTRQTVVLETAP